MPGWHRATEELQREGKVRMVGILQEQHPDRARLFMQWKKMDWPLLVDPLNRLGIAVVPVTVLIDEHGIVRYLRPGEKELQEFLATRYPAPQSLPAPPSPPDLQELRRQATQNPQVERLVSYADALYLWGGEEKLGEAIRIYRQALEQRPRDGALHFRLGVAYRGRYDSSLGQGDDFQQAVRHWGQALELNPNQYIWRRRIQQYGPRLQKPYPFYDWVPAAREEIQARGEEPSPLRVEPGGAEFAMPARTFDGAQALKEPDPEGRIYRDREGLVGVEVTVVPDPAPASQPVRVHVALRPNPAVKAHWNNEVDDLVLWVTPPQGWQVDRQLLSVPRPPEIVSQEVRRLEFEVKPPEGFSGTARIPAYALYYVCEDVDGTCLYRRQDLAVEVAFRP